MQFGFQRKDATTPVDFDVKHRKNGFFAVVVVVVGFHIVGLVFLALVHCPCAALCNFTHFYSFHPRGLEMVGKTCHAIVQIQIV